MRVNLKLDGGKSHSKTCFKKFFEDALSRVPKNYEVIFLRIDKGYFGENTFEYLEKRGMGYIGAAKNTAPLRKITSSTAKRGMGRGGRGQALPCRDELRL